MAERIETADAAPSALTLSDAKPQGQNTESEDLPQPDVSAEMHAAVKEQDAQSAGSDDHPVADHPDRPDPDSIRITPDRADHILNGDGNGTGGGHRSGTGFAGKTEFPASWDDEKTLDNIEDVARNPDVMPVEPQANGRWRYEGMRDDVQITAIVNPDGTVHTAWPREGDPGVVKNPEEG